MSPQEKLQFEQMQKRLTALETVQNVSFIETLKRRVFSSLVITDLPAIKLSNLSDVEDTDSATTGYVLKKTATTWQPATDIDT